MTTIYLINNSLTMNNIIFPESENLKYKREKRILSIEGEEESKLLSTDSELQNTNIIFASPYVMSIASAKYLAKTLELEINIKAEIGERIIGSLGNKTIRVFQEMQENDFDYSLNGGESLNEVKKRMLNFLNKNLKLYEDKTITMFTHNVAITALLSTWCDKGYNLDNRLILNYKEEAIVDGTWNNISIIKLEFNKDKLINITRKK